MSKRRHLRLVSPPKNIEPSPITYRFTDPVLQQAHCDFQQSLRAPNPGQPLWIEEAQYDSISDLNHAYVREADQLLRPYGAYMLCNGDVYQISSVLPVSPASSPPLKLDLAAQQRILHVLHDEHANWDEEAQDLMGNPWN